ncbi:MAG TPA: YfhO family protein, partial [Gemmatimonadaceae bacterium]
VILGGLMGAIQFLPVMEYTPWSPRAGGQGYAYAITFSFPPEELINTYLPQFSGLLDAYWGRNGIHFHSEYIGAVVLMLAGAGIGAVRSRGFARFWLGAFIVALLWSLGGFTPFYHLVYALVPGSKFFRAPSTIFYIVSFCVAIFAALGVERIAAREIGPRYLIGWLIAGVVVVLLAVSGGFTNMGEVIGGAQSAGMVDANAPAVALGALRSLLFVVLACAVLMLFLRGKLALPATALALLVLAAVDLWTIDRHYWGSSPPAKVVYEPNEITEYITRATREEQGRVFTIPPQTASSERHDPYLRGDALMVNDIRMVMGYHGNELGRYQLLDGFAQGQVEQRVLGTPNFARLTNMKYILTDLDSLGIPGYQRLVGPAKDSEGSTLYLFGVPGDNPPAWVVPVIVKAPDESVFATVLDPRFDPATAALFDTSADVNAVQVKQLPAPLDLHAAVTRYDPGHITVKLDKPAPAGAALMVSENYYPGWRATVDGKPAKIGRADFTLIGVELPAGARDVELTYASATYERGRAITVVTLLLAVAAAVAGIMLERRRRVRG